MRGYVFMLASKFSDLQVLREIVAWRPSRPSVSAPPLTPIATVVVVVVPTGQEHRGQLRVHVDADSARPMWGAGAADVSQGASVHSALLSFSITSRAHDVPHQLVNQLRKVSLFSERDLRLLFLKCRNVRYLSLVREIDATSPLPYVPSCSVLVSARSSAVFTP